MTGIGEALEAEWAQVRSRLPHHHQDAAPVPTFTPKQASQSQPEVPSVTTFDKIKNILAAADEKLIDDIDLLIAHPEGIGAISKLAAMAGIAFPSGTITGALSTADLVLRLFAQQPSAPAQQGQQAAQQAADGSGAQAPKTPAVLR
jgi:hypothetical protein